MSKDGAEKAHIVTLNSGSLTANTATVISEIFRSPSSSSVVLTGAGYGAGGTAAYVGGKAVEQSTPPPTAEATQARTSGHAAQNGQREITLRPTFKMIFLSVAGITLLSGVAHVALAVALPAPTPNQQTAFDAMGFAWQAGIGAMVGLLGGKVT